MRISKVKDVKTPARGTDRSAGIDFFVPNDFEEKVLKPGESVRIPSGIRVEVPKGFALIAFNKSGVALSGLQVGACVVDEDYQGEISLHVFNFYNNDHDVTIKPGMKLTQFILIPVSYEDVELVEGKDMHPVKTQRGDGGFGSTGTT